MLTKNQTKILELFVSQITESFTMREIERILKMRYSLVQYAIKPLKENNLIKIDKHKLLSLNYKENHDTLTYVEYYRRNNFLHKKQNKTLALFINEFINNFKEESFVLLLFGSAVTTEKPNDIDLLIIVDAIEKTTIAEKNLYNTSRKYGFDKDIHITSISHESVYEMLNKREQINILNETLNKHIIIYGAESYYRLITRGRK